MTGDGPDPSTRAQELRATLGAIVEEAQQLSERLVAESRDEAAATTREAQDRADELLSRARSDAEQISEQARAAADAIRAEAEAEVEEHRRRVRAEVTEEVTQRLTQQSRHELAQVRAQSHALIGDLEASVRILGVSLESAVDNVTEMLTALESLRLHMVDPDADPVPLETDTTGEQPAFGSQPPPTSVPASASVFDRAGPEAAHEDDRTGQPVQTGSEDRAEPTAEEPAPLTASEAFLRASQLERDELAFAGMDQTQDREEREELPWPHERHGDPTAGVDPGGQPGQSGSAAGDTASRRDDEDPAKPLRWLFRSPH